jgi:aminoglycoside 6-adenylyltransferase
MASIERQLATTVLDQIITWATAHPSIRAVLLTSTRSVPGAPVDQLSDYDVILVVEDVQPWATERDWLADFGEVLVVYWDPIHPDPDFGIDICGNVTQYADGLKLDFTLWPTALLQAIVASPVLPAELDAGYRVLFDKDGLAAQLPPPTYRAYLPKPPAEAEYQTWINDFLTDAPYVAKCLWRDELFPAKWCLDYDMKQIYLLKMLEWRVGVEHNWTVGVGALGKGLKKRLPAELWPAVEACFAGVDVADNWLALDHTMACFRQIAVEVGDALGYAYPHDLHDRVAAYVAQIRQLAPPQH